MFGRGNAYRIDLGIAIMPLPSNEYWSCSGQGINGGTCGGCYYERRSRTYFGSAGEMNFIVSEGGRYVWFDSAAFTGKTNLFSSYYKQLRWLKDLVRRPIIDVLARSLLQHL